MKKVLVVCTLMVSLCCLAFAGTGAVSSDAVKALEGEQREALKMELESLTVQYGAVKSTNDLEALQSLMNRIDAIHADLGDYDNLPIRGSLDQGGETCADATVIGALPFCDNGNTVGFDSDYGAFFVPSLCSNFSAQPASPDVVYSYTPLTTEVVTVSLCGSSYDTYLGVWAGCPDSPEGALACCNDDSDCDGDGFNELQSCCTFDAIPGVTYYIVVAGYSTAAGAYSISVNLEGSCAPCDAPCPVSPVADLCDDAIAVTAPLASYVGSTVGQTVDNPPFCGTGDGTRGGVWFSVVGANNFLTATTCNPCSNYDTKIRVYTGDCANLVCVAGNDDNCPGDALKSTVSWCAEEGVTYFILVHGFGSAQGTFELSIEEGSYCGPIDCRCCESETSHIADPEPDAPIDSAIPTTCVTLNVPVEYHITDVNVCIDLDHTFLGDLDITLQSPAGTIVQLYEQHCSGDDNLICFSFDDEAAGPIDCNLPSQDGQSVTPYEALSAFDGENAVGPWVLCITDNFGGDEGSLHWFCLTFEYDEILPVELVGFDAIAGDRAVTLHWQTASETDNDHFDISRNGSVVGRVDANGSTAGGSYQWIDADLNNGTEYTYTVSAIDVNGAAQELFTVSATPTYTAATITEYALHQNFPNPFNPETQIVFDLVDAGDASLTVFNALGQTIATLVNGNMNAGRHTVNFNAADMPSGLYFYRLEAGDFSAIKKMVLMK